MVLRMGIEEGRFMTIQIALGGKREGMEEREEDEGAVVREDRGLPV